MESSFVLLETMAKKERTPIKGTCPPPEEWHTLPKRRSIALINRETWYYDQTRPCKEKHDHPKHVRDGCPVCRKASAERGAEKRRLARASLNESLGRAARRPKQEKGEPAPLYELCPHVPVTKERIAEARSHYTYRMLLRDHGTCVAERWLHSYFFGYYKAKDYGSPWKAEQRA